MKKEIDIDIRYTRALDAPYLKQWLADPNVLPWIGASSPQEIDAFSSYWISLSKYQCSLTATDNHIPCGIATLFLMPYKKVSHHSPFKICVDPKRWNEGIGTALLRNIQHLARQYFQLEEIYVEVFGDTPLICLLEKSGFVQFARQEHYIKTAEGVYFPRSLWITEFWKEKDSAI